MNTRTRAWPPRDEHLHQRPRGDRRREGADVRPSRRTVRHAHGPDIVFTITYRKGHGQQHEGSMVEGGHPVKVKEGHGLQCQLNYSLVAPTSAVCARRATRSTSATDHVVVTRRPVRRLPSGGSQRGMLVDPADDLGRAHRPAVDHTVWWQGSMPCHRDGTPIARIDAGGRATSWPRA